MVVKHIEIYGVHISRKCICKSKKKKKKKTESRPFYYSRKSFFSSYHHSLGRDKLLICRS